MRRYLVVENQTLMSDELRAAVRERLGTPPCRFHVRCRPRRRGITSPGRRVPRWSSRASGSRRRWRGCTPRARSAPARSVTPTPSSPSVEALPRDRFDEIVVSTLPLGLSRWMRQDFPHPAGSPHRPAGDPRRRPSSPHSRRADEHCPGSARRLPRPHLRLMRPAWYITVLLATAGVVAGLSTAPASGATVAARARRDRRS